MIIDTKVTIIRADGTREHPVYDDEGRWLSRPPEPNDLEEWVMPDGHKLIIFPFPMWTEEAVPKKSHDYNPDKPEFAPAT